MALSVSPRAAHHIMCFCFTQETRIFNAEDDVAGSICQALV